ncbi:hypothetical protein [Alkalibacterium sp. 20]|uniref:hypothetical protein n=1 Tax=Alkalibacterium sp. 20 TaxID=1798803 RepID=UPI0009004847|nr:hypothetical protein [Alkalibacterium sp. 20]OJF90991.1 hypothetical protein AX762_11520 [Alkalibacterium sp. 20]
MIENKIDQFNLVLRDESYDLISKDEWQPLAEQYIKNLVESLKLEKLFGKLSDSDSFRPAGYDVVYNFNKFPPHAIGYSLKQPQKGVLVSTNAHFWNIWQERYFEEYGKRLELYTLYKMVQHPKLYTTHFSRVDLVVDFIDEGIDVGALYRSLVNGRSDVYYEE